MHVIFKNLKFLINPKLKMCYSSSLQPLHESNVSPNTWTETCRCENNINRVFLHFNSTHKSPIHVFFLLFEIHHSWISQKETKHNYKQKGVFLTPLSVKMNQHLSITTPAPFNPNKSKSIISIPKLLNNVKSRNIV